MIDIKYWYVGIALALLSWTNIFVTGISLGYNLLGLMLCLDKNNKPSKIRSKEK